MGSFTLGTVSLSLIFGIIITWPLGNFPYPCVSSRNLLQYLAKGNRLSCPGNCSEELFVDSC